jgi:kynureninase
MNFERSQGFARKLDRQDPLRSFRNRFQLPKTKGKTAIYLAGNSLGLQPKNTGAYLQQELKDWATLGVEGHLHGKRPWLYYHHLFKKGIASLAGAKESEVVTMNQLTVNLHLMLTSFYKPDNQRFRIITESGAFSSDQYAVESQIRLRNQPYPGSHIELAPRPGEHWLRTDDIIESIRKNGPQLSLVLLSGVQYYSGQRFNIKAITKAGHEAGAKVGFDLAHAIGNVPLSLHDDDVDFAVWCGYKYLNSGPGSVAGAYIHERHANAFHLNRLAGWWGHNEEERFDMKKGFKPMPGADGWQVSNFPVFSGAPLLASLEIFKEAGMNKLRSKSIQLTSFAEFVLNEIDPHHQHYSIITPGDPEQRGCQLSIMMYQNGKKVFDSITRAGVICDWREPDVIRIAPVPLYNSFLDVWRFGEILSRALGIPRNINRYS